MYSLIEWMGHRSVVFTTDKKWERDWEKRWILLCVNGFLWWFEWPWSFQWNGKRERERELSARNESKEDGGRDVLERMFFSPFSSLLFKRMGFYGEKEGNRKKKRNRQKKEEKEERGNLFLHVTYFILCITDSEKIRFSSFSLFYSSLFLFSSRLEEELMNIRITSTSSTSIFLSLSFSPSFSVPFSLSLWTSFSLYFVIQTAVVFFTCSSQARDTIWPKRYTSRSFRFLDSWFMRLDDGMRMEIRMRYFWKWSLLFFTLSFLSSSSSQPIFFSSSFLLLLSTWKFQALVVSKSRKIKSQSTFLFLLPSDS